MMTSELGLFSAELSRQLENMGVMNGRPQGVNVASELTHLLLIGYQGRRFFPKLALHVECGAFPDGDLATFYAFARDNDGPFGSCWLYVRISDDAQPKNVAVRIARFVERLWVRTRRDRPRITAHDLTTDPGEPIDLPTETDGLLSRAHLTDWFDQRTTFADDVVPRRESGIVPAMPRSTAAAAAVTSLTNVARCGTIVEVNSSGVLVESDGERYWAFYGSFLDLGVARKMGERVRADRTLRLQFRPLVTAQGHRYATRVALA